MKRKFLLIAAILIMAMITMSSCGGTFSIDCSNEKAIHVDAKNANTDDWVVTGSLVVEDGEDVVFTSNLEKGEIKIELFGTTEEQSIDELPDEPSGEATSVFVARETDSMAVSSFAAGSYLVKATVTEKATGTIDITAGTEDDK